MPGGRVRSGPTHGMGLTLSGPDGVCQYIEPVGLQQNSGMIYESGDQASIWYGCGRFGAVWRVNPLVPGGVSGGQHPEKESENAAGCLSDANYPQD